MVRKIYALKRSSWKYKSKCEEETNSIRVRVLKSTWAVTEWNICKIQGCLTTEFYENLDKPLWRSGPSKMTLHFKQSYQCTSTLSLGSWTPFALSNYQLQKKIEHKILPVYSSVKTKIKSKNDHCAVFHTKISLFHRSGSWISFQF